MDNLDNRAVCHCCKRDRERKSLEPRILLQYHPTGLTKTAALLLCEYCDGEQVLKLVEKGEEPLP